MQKVQYTAELLFSFLYPEVLIPLGLHRTQHNSTAREPEVEYRAIIPIGEVQSSGVLVDHIEFGIEANERGGLTPGFPERTVVREGHRPGVERVAHGVVQGAVAIKVAEEIHSGAFILVCFDRFPSGFLRIFHHLEKPVLIQGNGDVVIGKYPFHRREFGILPGLQDRSRHAQTSRGGELIGLGIVLGAFDSNFPESGDCLVDEAFLGPREEPTVGSPGNPEHSRSGYFIGLDIGDVEGLAIGGLHLAFGNADAVEVVPGLFPGAELNGFVHGSLEGNSSFHAFLLMSGWKFCYQVINLNMV